MPVDTSNLISYYKDCYQADTRTLSITNVFASKVENRFFLSDKDELLSGDLPYYPIPDQYADSIVKNLAIYKREKVLYCAAFFVFGKNENALNGSGKVCAPLFLFPAKIVEGDDVRYVQIDFEKRIINIHFLNSIKKAESEHLYERLSKVSKKITDIAPLMELKTILEENLEDFNAEDILMYPELVSESKLKRVCQPKQLASKPGFHLVPSISFCVLRRSSSTMGIISELQMMGLKGDFSAPLKYLFEPSLRSKVADSHNRGKIPAVLSEAQKEVVKSSSENVCTLVIGPPGTGKSYTIATLAVEHMSKGESVLIASKTDQAVDVVYKKISIDLNIKEVALRAGKSDYRKKLKGKLNNLLISTRKRPQDKSDLFLLEKEITEVEESLDKHSKMFIKLVENELRWGEFLSKYTVKSGFFARLKIRYIKWRNSLNEPHWVVNGKFLESSEKHIELIKKHITLKFRLQVHHALYFSRRMFRNFLKSITARHSSSQDELFKTISLPLLLESFPIWLCNMSDLNDVLPLEKEMFDLAIIDESSQCDIASCLPIIQRAKRVVIVGDPKQLRHASFLSQSVQKSLQKKYSLSGGGLVSYLDYRNTSILDLVNDRIENQDQVCFLDEHFRSRPDLIAFSNQQFYEGKLKIMTKMPVDDNQGSFEIIQIEGERNSHGVNEVEAHSVINYLKKLIEDQKSVPVELCQTIGILSPFRDQVDFIAKLLAREVAVESIEKYSLTCGTAYSFQGEERDIMLLSMAIDDNSHHSALIHLNKPEVFNVATTRARVKQVIFKSFSDQFDCGEYLKKYLSQVSNFTLEGPVLKQTTHDIFLKGVIKRLQEQSLKIWVEFPIAGLTVDLVFERSGQYFGVNLIGYSGAYQAAMTHDEHKSLVRAGLPTFPLPYSYWQFDQQACFNELISFSNKK